MTIGPVIPRWISNKYEYFRYQSTYGWHIWRLSVNVCEWKNVSVDQHQCILFARFSRVGFFIRFSSDCSRNAAFTRRKCFESLSTRLTATRIKEYHEKIRNYCKSSVRYRDIGVYCLRYTHYTYRRRDRLGRCTGHARFEEHFWKVK